MTLQTPIKVLSSTLLTTLLILEMLTNSERTKFYSSTVRFVLFPVNYAVSPAARLKPANLKFLWLVKGSLSCYRLWVDEKLTVKVTSAE